MIVTMTDKKPRQNLSLSHLSAGRFLGSAEVAAILDVPESTLRTLVSEQVNNGRVVKTGGKTFEVPPSPRAVILPEPVGVLRTLVWDAAEIEAVAAEFLALKNTRGKKSSAE